MGDLFATLSRQWEWVCSSPGAAIGFTGEQ
jgi:hypothetical protein